MEGDQAEVLPVTGPDSAGDVVVIPTPQNVVRIQKKAPRSTAGSRPPSALTVRSAFVLADTLTFVLAA